MEIPRTTPCPNPEILDEAVGYLNDQMQAQNPGCLKWAVEDPRSKTFSERAAANEEATLGLLQSCPKFHGSSDTNSCMLVADEVCPIETQVQALRATYRDWDLQIDEH